MSLPGPAGLYDPRDEHDACGVGFVVDIQGRRSHRVIEQGLQILLNLLHRGACGCEANTGDGAGILIQMPDRFLRKATGALGFALPPAGHYGAGLVFLPTNQPARERLRQLIEETVRAEGHGVLGWRVVPGDDSSLGASARLTKPVIEQLFVEDRRRSASESEAAARQHFERALYVIRKQVEHAADRLALPDATGFYIVSLSANTLIYKGMLTADQIAPAFPDLTDPEMDSALALVHQRFSTNTFPSWPLAHPYRYVAHNGEINTLRGNVNWMRAREGLLKSAVFGDDLKKILPVIREGGSDTATFDNVLELLVMSGRSLPHAVLMMIPEPWSSHETMTPEVKAFYEFHSSLMEPWDGPASIAFTDGSVIGAVLDRNGLRPSRYYVTTDGLVVMASEVGVLDIPAENIVMKGRLHPGRLFLVDTVQGRIVPDEEVKRELAAAQPYGQWLTDHLIDIEDLPDPPHLPPISHERILQRQQLFGYTQEDLGILLAPMATNGEEPIGSMGTDTALAVLSNRPRLLYDYFKQLFAQVTNPPLDAIREQLVTTMESTIGPEGNLLEPGPDSCRQIKIKYPIIDND
ncbi:MAG TPA: glutamate synthase central domain-containing protein, partial [Vicinamibacterales bacterium]